MITAGRNHPRLYSGTADVLARERRRIAADVHDLIMQDLALALGSARTLADTAVETAPASVVVAAGERALAAAREMVDSLMEGPSKPVAEAVETGARLAARHTPLSFVATGIASGAPEPEQATLHALVHVAREAVTNAVKHGLPAAIEVCLGYAQEWHLRVRDDGRGFDPKGGGGGFGLHSMRRQAEALGGALWVTSGPGLGTTVEVVLP